MVMGSRGAAHSRLLGHVGRRHAEDRYGGAAGTHDAPMDLVIFGIGPVQSYIASARRTQDLWAGSELLSSLARVGLEAAEEHGATVLFPGHTDEGAWPNSIPNRFALETPQESTEHVVEQVEAAVRDAWDDVSRKVREWLARIDPAARWKDTWTRQVDNWLEVYWIAWPWDGADRGEYGVAYSQASLAYDARKAIRQFPALAEPGEKCSLCGSLAALHGKDDIRGAVRAFWRDLRLSSRMSPGTLRLGEQLCAACAVKRFAALAGTTVGGEALRPPERFPSTSSIAAATFRAAVIDKWTSLGPAVRTHLTSLEALSLPVGAPYRTTEDAGYLAERARGVEGAEELLRYDGSLFYIESFGRPGLVDLLERDPQQADLARAAAAATSLRALLKAAEEAGIPAPHSYYAIVLMDGDHMGRLLGDCSKLEEHQQISRALVRFAEEDVPEVVERLHAGRVVYAGGDDVLALVPVAHCLGVANALQDRFRATMLDKAHKEATGSVGIAIVHQHFPLGAGLRAARGAEKQAKDALGRNALCVALHRRSGEITKVGLNWAHSSAGQPDALKTFERVRQLLTEGALSSRVVYDLDLEAAALEHLPHDGRRLELRRLLTRHWLLKVDEGQQEAIEGLAGNLAGVSLYSRMDMQALARWLGVMRFLAQGEVTR